MVNRHKNRERAYYFLAEQAKILSTAFKYTCEKTNTNVELVSLDELYRIKKGLADPSPELVIKIKKAFTTCYK
jgi:hypothetical protein